MLIGMGFSLELVKKKKIGTKGEQTEERGTFGEHGGTRKKLGGERAMPARYGLFARRNNHTRLGMARSRGVGRGHTPSMRNPAYLGVMRGDMTGGTRHGDTYGDHDAEQRDMGLGRMPDVGRRKCPWRAVRGAWRPLTSRPVPQYRPHPTAVYGQMRGKRKGRHEAAPFHRLAAAIKDRDRRPCPRASPAPPHGAYVPLPFPQAGRRRPPQASPHSWRKAGRGGPLGPPVPCP